MMLYHSVLQPIIIIDTIYHNKCNESRSKNNENDNNNNFNNVINNKI